MKVVMRGCYLEHCSVGKDGRSNSFRENPWLFKRSPALPTKDRFGASFGLNVRSVVNEDPNEPDALRLGSFLILG